MADDTKSREMPALDKIHILFLLYSGAHNVINAFSYAHNAIFFVFVVVGILCVELMLWAVYHHWKDGRLIGPMLRVSAWAGAFAIFFAMAGILAQAQSDGGAGWVLTYYAWIMPLSAPVMFVFAFLIQSVDPITQADRMEIAYAHKVDVEKRTERLDIESMNLDSRRSMRKVKMGIQRQRIAQLWAEAFSRRVTKTLKSAASVEVPQLMKQLGIKTPRPGGRFSWSSKYTPYKLLQEGPSVDEASGDGRLGVEPPDVTVGGSGKL